MPMIFGSTLTLAYSLSFFFYFFQAYVLPLQVSVLGYCRLGLGLRFRVYLLHLVRFYQAYCSLVMRYYYVTCGV